MTKTNYSADKLVLKKCVIKLADKPAHVVAQNIDELMNELPSIKAVMFQVYDIINMNLDTKEDEDGALVLITVPSVHCVDLVDLRNQSVSNLLDADLSQQVATSIFEVLQEEYKATVDVIYHTNFNIFYAVQLAKNDTEDSTMFMVKYLKKST